MVYVKGAGCALMQRATRFKEIVEGMKSVLDVPLSVKMRVGIYDKQWNACQLVPKLRDLGVDFVSVRGFFVDGSFLFDLRDFTDTWSIKRAEVHTASELGVHWQMCKGCRSNACHW